MADISNTKGSSVKSKQHASFMFSFFDESKDSTTLKQ